MGLHCGVFHYRANENFYVVRLNCAHFSEQLVSSPCVIFLEKAFCGHLKPAQPDTMVHVRITDGQYPYCERDLVDPTKWGPVVWNTTKLIHLDTQDVDSCSYGISLMAAKVVYHLGEGPKQ